MTQKEMILKWMQTFGEITPIDALRDIGCLRLAARISDLRRDGYAIKSRIVSDKGRLGNTVHYAAYRLEEVEA